MRKRNLSLMSSQSITFLTKRKNMQTDGLTSTDGEMVADIYRKLLGLI